MKKPAVWIAAAAALLCVLFAAIAKRKTRK